MEKARRVLKKLEKEGMLIIGGAEYPPELEVFREESVGGGSISFYVLAHAAKHAVDVVLRRQEGFPPDFEDMLEASRKELYRCGWERKRDKTEQLLFEKTLRPLEEEEEVLPLLGKILFGKAMPGIGENLWYFLRVLEAGSGEGYRLYLVCLQEFRKRPGEESYAHHFVWYGAVAASRDAYRMLAVYKLSLSMEESPLRGEVEEAMEEGPERLEDFLWRDSPHYIEDIPFHTEEALRRFWSRLMYSLELERKDYYEVVAVRPEVLFLSPQLLERIINRQRLLKLAE